MFCCCFSSIGEPGFPGLNGEIGLPGNPGKLAILLEIHTPPVENVQQVSHWGSVIVKVIDLLSNSI